MGAVIKKLRLKQATYEPRAYPNPGEMPETHVADLDC